MIGRPAKGMRVRLSPKGLEALQYQKDAQGKLGTLTTGKFLNDRGLRVKWDGCKCPDSYSVHFLEEAPAEVLADDYQI